MLIKGKRPKEGESGEAVATKGESGEAVATNKNFPKLTTRDASLRGI